MINQHLLRFKVDSLHSNTLPWEKALQALPEEFTRADVVNVLRKQEIDSPEKVVIYKWTLAGAIETMSSVRVKGAKNMKVRFKKIIK